MVQHTYRHTHEPSPNNISKVFKHTHVVFCFLNACSRKSVCFGFYILWGGLILSTILKPNKHISYFSKTCSEHCCINPLAGPQCRYLGHLKQRWKQESLLNRHNIHKEVRYELQIRAFINIEVDRSIKLEELENFEELGKMEVEWSSVLQREGCAFGDYQNIYSVGGAQDECMLVGGNANQKKTRFWQGSSAEPPSAHGYAGGKFPPK